MEIGKIIKENRLLHNLTQEELGNVFFVSRQLISKWETGKSYPDLNQLIQLSDYFGLSLDELMRGDKKMVNKLSFNIKSKNVYIISIITVVVIAIFVSYFYWENKVVQLKPTDIEIISVTVSEDEGSEHLDVNTGENILFPDDISYSISFKIKKPFIDLATGYYFDSDENNLYVDLRGQNKLSFTTKEKEYTFQILSDTKEISENSNIVVDENYRTTLVKNKKVKIIDLSDSVNQVNNNLVELNSWLLIDPVDIK